ncbi:MAG: TIGR01841 family phasin [Noviherbaspirillum sp.]
MFPTQDQISAATKANFEANLALYTALSNKTLESVEKLLTLNLTAVKASMEESSAATKQILSAKDAQEFLSLVGAQAKPNFEKAIAYNNHLSSIASNAQAEFTKLTEARIVETSRKVTALVDEAAKKAPAGSETVFALLKTAFGNASSGYEQLAKTGKQAVEAIEANLNSTGNQFAQVAGQAKN